MKGSLIVFLALAFPLLAQQKLITDAPEVRDPFTLTALYDSEAGHNAFSYDGKAVPPTIRVLPGHLIE